MVRARGSLMTAPTAAVTPMMAQYLDIKSGCPDALLFYRMGDFYELFFDDAVAAAAALDIALTKRGKHLGDDIPMCGVPVHSAEAYLLTLIRKGFRVAVCEQVEDPAEARKRGSKSVVKREVVRLVTPGTLTEESLLEARRHNFLAAFCDVRGDGALAWVDISTGAFRVMPCARGRLAPELARLMPSEILVSEALEPDLAAFVMDCGASVTPLARGSFDSASAEGRLLSALRVSTLEAFGAFSRPEIGAMGAIVSYLDLTQRGRLPLLRPPQREIDAATRRNLELTRSLSGGREGSLLSAIDRTVTAGGGRLLERRLSSPSRDLDVIHDRLSKVDALVDETALRVDVRATLRPVPDMTRALSRLALDRGGPRDLAAIRSGLTQGAAIAAFLAARLPDIFVGLAASLTGHEKLVDLLDDALDEARTLRDEGRSVIARMQAEYARDAGISSLKIKHNNVLGYFIETTATHAEKMLSTPLSDTFIHRQTTANAVRFTTVPLSELETRILNAGGRALEIEKRLYLSLRGAVLERSAEISDASGALADIDVAAALADLAAAGDWARPTVDDSRTFRVEGGRHPVVEKALKADGAPFVANDCVLDPGGDAAVWLITGPNMAGKSTFLRQNALIALLAQCGSYVPADSAHIGLVSQIFSRVGASDDLARGRSTFMVEMVETAAILNQADDRALVILDEIGRGTATYDGLSIAWATVEHLHEANRCRALFATHYHELTALAEKLPGLINATMTVREWEGEVIFLHEVRAGAADRSYGVQVAKLAGLPQSVVERAQSVLEALEKGEREGPERSTLIDDLPLFSVKPQAAPTPKKGPHPVEARLAEIHPDTLSPRQALELVYTLKDLIEE